MGIRPEVAGLIFLFKAGQAKARPFLRQIHFDEQETFVVAEGNIVARSVFLDQLAFEQ